MKEKDYEYIAKLEKAIAKKYGSVAIQNPKSFWNEEKEKIFLKSVKKFYKKVNTNKDQKRKYKTHFNDQVCSSCQKHHYFMSLVDEIAFVKYGLCNNCYIEIRQGREQNFEKLSKDKESNFKN